MNKNKETFEKKPNEKKAISQTEIIKEYFKKYPNIEIGTPTAVDWIVKEYKRRTGKVFRDPDRGIRTLHEQGFLIKIANGKYKYNSSYVNKPKHENFTQKQKKAIMEIDGYKCAKCSRGIEDGVQLHIDHIIAKADGGKAILSNGQVLCSTCNMKKKNEKLTEHAKKLFINLYNIAVELGDTKIINFTSDVLNMYDKHNINGHIEWKKDE